jgi:hypothetical protein
MNNAAAIEKYASTLDDLLIAVFDITEISSKHVGNAVVDCLTPIIMNTNPNTVCHHCLFITEFH